MRTELMPNWDKPDEEKTVDAETVKADVKDPRQTIGMHNESTSSYPPVLCTDGKTHVATVTTPPHE
ncbi:hypothetical protein BT69DRAFT_1339382 [Atractiella rhizophila]|nr:hypothetical protein BT69DRAFT_1339382 [Atractiella rhizophila]